MKEISDKKSYKSMREKRIAEAGDSKAMKVSFWGWQFLKAFGEERDEYYRRKHGYTYPLPRGLRVQAENGITVDSTGRVSVMVVDNPNMKTISIPDAIEQVEKLFAQGKR